MQRALFTLIATLLSSSTCARGEIYFTSNNAVWKLFKDGPMLLLRM